MTVKRVIADADVSVDAKWQTDEIGIQIFGDLHITGKHLSSEDGAMKANTLMSPHRTGEERRVSQCSGHVYRFDLLLGQQQNAFNHDHYRIIVSYRYRDNFDLPYRLSIKNRI